MLRTIAGLAAKDTLSTPGALQGGSVLPNKRDERRRLGFRAGTGARGASGRPISAWVVIQTENLDAALGLPILLWDERLSTFAAEELAYQAGLRGPKRAEVMDALAAAAILQDLLDALARREGRTQD